MEELHRIAAAIDTQKSTFVLIGYSFNDKYEQKSKIKLFDKKIEQNVKKN